MMWVYRHVSRISATRLGFLLIKYNYNNEDYSWQWCTSTIIKYIIMNIVIIIHYGEF